MPQQEQEKERQRLIALAKSHLERYSRLPSVEYSRPNLGVELGFEELELEMAKIAQFSIHLLALPLDDLALQVAEFLVEATSQLESRLNEMRDFNVAELTARNENALNVRNGIVNNFRADVRNFWKFVGGPAAVLEGLQAALHPLRAQGSLNALVTKSEEALARVAEREQQVESILATARDAAAKVGVSQHARHFKEEAELQGAAARRWLVATIAIVLLTAGAVTTNVWYAITHPHFIADGWGLQLVLAKLLAFSLLLTATLWCGRIYRSHAHNRVVNRHRQNALSSFETFVAAAGGDEQTKNAVLLHAAQSIFTPQPTGYLGAEAEAGGQSQLVEIVRTISGKGGQ